MHLRPAQDELAQLAEFQRRHRASPLCIVCSELADGHPAGPTVAPTGAELLDSRSPVSRPHGNPNGISAGKA